MYRASARATPLLFTTFNGVLNALELETGTERWQHTASGQLRSSALVVADDDHVFVISDVVAALHHETGQLLWTCPLPFQKIADAIVRDAYLIVSGAGLICAIDTARGVEAWRARGNVTLVDPSQSHR